MKDLQGKRLAVTAGDSLTQQWPVVAETNGLGNQSVNLVYMDAAAKPVALMSGRVDAMLGTCIDHVIVVESKGHPAQCLRFADNGVPTVGVTVIANANVIKTNPDLVKRFVGAAIKSYKAFYENPQAAMDAAARARPDLDRKVIGAQGEIIKTYYGALPVGQFDNEKWRSTVETMKKTGSLTGDQPYNSYFISDFVKP
jgi:NitT/TauT family transport system substrate-binding protein